MKNENTTLISDIFTKRFLLILILFIVSVFSVIWGKTHLSLWIRSFFLIPLSFSISYILTPLIGHLALRFNIVDIPNNRKMHKSPTPLLGGVPVYIGFAIATASSFWYSFQLKGIVYGATLIFIIGILDDIKGLSSILRLFFQALAGFILILHGMSIDAIPNLSNSMIFEYAITLLWVVGIANAVNFLDGLDGLCSGFGAIASIFFGIIALLTHQYFLMFMAFSLSGSCLGFLPWNFISGKPAKIFLGDAGSLFIGFTLASFAILGDWAENKTVALSVPILILFLPIFDTIMTSFMRIKNGSVKSFREWLDFVGKDHFHHRLFILGIGKRNSVWTVYAFTAMLGFSAIIIRTGGTNEAYLALAQAFILLIFFIAFIISVHKQNEDKSNYKENETNN